MAEPGMKEKIQQWLTEQGYPLEIEVARIMRSVGLVVTQSTFFRDPETNDAREIDVVASYREFTEPWGWDFEILIVVECKSGRDKPWVAFTSADFEPIFEGSVVVQRPASVRGFEMLVKVSLDDSMQKMMMFRLPERPAVTLVRAFKGQRDDAFNAMVALSKAAVHYANDVPADGPGRPRRARIVLPIIVIDAPLVECFPDASGDLHLSDLEWVRVAWRRQLADSRLAWPLTFLDVVTLDHLPTYMSQLRSDLEQLVAAFHASVGTRASELHPPRPPQQPVEEPRSE